MVMFVIILVMCDGGVGNVCDGRGVGGICDIAVDGDVCGVDGGVDVCLPILLPIG